MARTLVEVAKDDPNLQQQQGSAGGLGAIVAAESVSPGQLDGVGDRAANVLALLLDLVCDLMQYVPDLATHRTRRRRRSCLFRRRGRRIRGRR